MTNVRVGQGSWAEHAGAALWHVLGAGALGTVIAHRLGTAGVPCTLLGHRGAATRQLRIAGVEHRVPVVDIDTLGEQRIHRLLLTTKAGQIAAAMDRALPHLAADAVVLTTANGLGLPKPGPGSSTRVQLRDGLLRAVSTAAAFRDASGTVTLAAIGETLVGGEAVTAPWFSDSLARLPDWRWVTDIRTAIHGKFALNCVINPLTAVRRCRNGELLSDPGAAQELASLCHETQPALQALGLWPDAEALLPRAQRVCRDTAANRSSMLQDILAGRETEIEYLTGELLRRAQHLGTALPRNAALYESVRALHPALSEPYRADGH